MSRSLRVAGGVLAVALVLSACTTKVPGVATGTGGGVVKQQQSSETDSNFISNTDGSDIDKLAGTVVKDVEKFWTDEFPRTFDGKQWQPLRGGYFSVDTSDATSKAPPCTNKAADVEGNAFYCSTADIIAWDRASLLPVLKQKFGEAAVMLVLAHEMGHAVQYRAGITSSAERNNPAKYPTILLETQADCYAGAFVNWVAEGKAERLRMDRDALDPALEAMTLFRDPVGTSQNAKDAHGAAFDRVSAFQDGFEKGTRLCAEMSIDNRVFTQKGFVSEDDKALGGNLPFDQAVKSIRENVEEYLTTQVGQLGKQWDKPKVSTVQTVPKCTRGDQGPVAFCPDNDQIDIQTTGKLKELHTKIGDWSTGTIITSRYALSVLKSLGKPVSGPDAQREVLCVSGAYSKELLTRKGENVFALSPGDLDEAVQLLLGTNLPARDVDGKALATGFERVNAFRTGVVDGLRACKLG